VHPIELGGDTFRQGYIHPDTVMALVKVLKKFLNLTGSYNVDTYHVVATSAVRDASNKDMLLDRILQETGLTINVLDAVEEERVIFQALDSFLEAERGAHRRVYRTLLLDLGGGSTEVMAIENKSIVLGGSRRLGTARIFHSMNPEDCEDNRAILESMIFNFVDSSKGILGGKIFDELFIRNQAFMKIICSHMNVKAPENGIRVSATVVKRIVAKLENESLASLCEKYDILNSEVEYALAAILIVKEYLRLSRAKKIFLANVDFLDGVIDDCITRIMGEDPQYNFRDQILNSVKGVASRYNVNLNHANKVLDLSIKLFDALAEFMGFSIIDRIYLKSAAILHDIGRFISDLDHHKHSKYIVSWSEFVGLNSYDRDLVALICRYHRKGRPRLSHSDYAALSQTDRVRVSKLASIIRIADALDRSHLQHISDIDVELADGALNIRAKAENDLSVEKNALKVKSQLFNDLTGMEVNLEREW
jgi:exopolyphosphatase/guanosine-5'-triphosphate,3'-diphosphate pyrophosphatase